MDQLHAAQAARPRHGKALAIDGQRHHARRVRTVDRHRIHIARILDQHLSRGVSRIRPHRSRPSRMPDSTTTCEASQTMPRAAPGSARDLFAQRGPALRLVACQLGRRQLSGADGQPLAPGRHGKQRGVGAARGEWRFGGLRLVRRRHRLLMRQRARRPPGRETGRGERGLARLIPGIRAQATPRSPGSPLRKKLSGMTAATYVPDPTVPAV